MKKRIINLSLFLISLIISFLVVEFAYRYFLFGGDSLSYAKINSLHEVGSSGLIKSSEYPEVVYEFKSDLDTYFKLVPFRTNSQGLRDQEYSLNKPEGTYRIAIIGDSFSVPEGVKLKQAYHTLLEKKLNQEDGEGSYEVINFSVGGYTLRQYAAVLKHKAQAYDPDLVVIGFCPQNDHKIPDETIFERQFEPNPATRPFFRSFVKMQTMRTLIQKYHSMTNSGSSGTDAVFTEQQKAYMSTYFDRMQEFSAENEIPVVVMFLYQRYDPYWRLYSKQLQSMVIAHDLYYVDVSHPFKGTNVEDYVIHELDPHPNAAANRIFARQLYRYLRNRVFDAHDVASCQDFIDASVSHDINMEKTHFAE